MMTPTKFIETKTVASAEDTEQLSMEKYVKDYNLPKTIVLDFVTPNYVKF